MQALILAGGLGTRLQSLLDDQPKPLAEVSGKPFLEYLLLQLKRKEVTNIILAIGYRGEMIRTYFQDGESRGLHLCYSQESQPLGTGGALKLDEHLIHEANFLAMNGDSFFDIDLDALVHHHQSKKAMATIALAKVENTQRFGAVEINAQGQIVRFLEKGQEEAGLINGGIYVFSKEIFSLISEGKSISLEREILPKLIGQGLYGLPFDAYFIDIGTPEDYLKLQADPSRLPAAVT